MTYADRAERYARAVVAGKVLACNLVVLACRRHLDDIAASEEKSFPFRFDAAKTNELCAYLELLPHVKGAWARRSERIKLEDWQCFAFGVPFGWVKKSNGLRRFRRAYTEIPRKNAKALALDTEIPTPFGFVPIADLHPGDTVFGSDGKPCRVVAESEVFDDHVCYEVEFSTGEVIVADAGHLWVTDARSDRERLKGVRGNTDGPKPSVKTTEAIRETLLVRGERNHRVAVAAAVEMPAADLPVPPYTFGAWLGDGHTDAGRVTVADGEVWDGIAGDGFDFGAAFPRGGAETRGVLGLVQGLRSAGVFGGKSLPDEYLFASVEQRHNLLAGLMDTDGTALKSGQCVFNTTNQRLAEGVRALVASLGMKPSVSALPAMLDGRECGVSYKVQFWAYNDTPVFRIERKRQRQKPVPKRATRTAFRQIVAVRRVPTVPVKCISVDSEDHTFLAGRSFIPTHNSTATAGLGLYMLTQDGEHGAEVYSGAGSEKQAWEVFGPARLMAKNTPELVEAYGLEVNAKSLSVPANGSKFEPIIGKPGDGASPSFSITDEYHEHATDEQLDTMVTGMGSREQPMAWVITTAGFDIASPCYALREEVVKMLDGTIPNDELWGLVYTIDEGVDWTSEEALRMANPNLGVSVYEEYLKSQQKDAINNPRKAATFKTKHLNLWVQARDPWMNMEAWKAQGDDTLTEDLFLGQRCWVGLDLSARMDLTAVVKVFRYDRPHTCSQCGGSGQSVDPSGGGVVDCLRCNGVGTAVEPHFYAFPRFYLPEERAMAPECHHYQGWVNSGHLLTCEGNEIDDAQIEEDLRRDARLFQIEELDFDPFGAKGIVQSLARDGVVGVEIPQNVKHLSAPMKEVEAAVCGGRFHHPAHRVFDWCISNVKAREDANENVFPRKESRESKIDGASALLNAMARALVAPAPAPVAYESRGITFL